MGINHFQIKLEFKRILFNNIYKIKQKINQSSSSTKSSAPGNNRESLSKEVLLLLILLEAPREKWYLSAYRELFDLPAKLVPGLTAYLAGLEESSSVSLTSLSSSTLSVKLSASWFNNSSSFKCDPPLTNEANLTKKTFKNKLSYKNNTTGKIIPSKAKNLTLEQHLLNFR